MLEFISKMNKKLKEMEGLVESRDKVSPISFVGEGEDEDDDEFRLLKGR